MRLMRLRCVAKSSQAIMARLWRLIWKLETLKLMLVKSLLVIALRLAILLLKSGWFVVVLAMFEDLVDALGDLHDDRSRECSIGTGDSLADLPLCRQDSHE